MSRVDLAAVARQVAPLPWAVAGLVALAGAPSCRHAAPVDVAHRAPGSARYPEAERSGCEEWWPSEGCAEDDCLRLA